MSISRIRIFNSRRELLGIASGAITASGLDADGRGVLVEEDGGSVTVSSPWYESIYDLAYDIVTASRYVSGIGGAVPADDGAFFIGGSDCDSIGERSSDKAITVTDLCPACSKCSREARLRSLAEFYLISFGMLKDVNLYTPEDLRARKLLLESRRVMLSPSCTAEAGERRTDEALDSGRLLGQYLAALHMYNYLASEYGKTTQICSSASDPCGFCVQTRAVQASCDGASGLRCVIKVTQLAGQEGLSVYAAVNKLEFQPYAASRTAGMQAVTEYVAPDGAAPYLRTTLARAEGYREDTHTGTWLFSMQYIPFFAVAQTKSSGGPVIHADTYNGKEYAAEDTSESGCAAIRYRGSGITYTMRTINPATKTDYLNSRGYLGTAPAGINRWQVEVTWTRTGALAIEPETSVFYYETPQASVPVDSLFEERTLRFPDI